MYNYFMEMQPKLPQQISEFGHACLAALADGGYGKTLSLGGAFGLSYYFEYRPTYDIDAWWEETATEKDRQAVVQCLVDALLSFGKVNTRRWGDVVSIELIPTGQERVGFSFQIAQRSARLEQPVPAPWPPGLQIDAFTDLLASKMVALVERGAPRDLRDVYAICQAGLATPTQCWELWRRRQVFAGADDSSGRARLAVQTHLGRIAAYRPLEGIVDPLERDAATKLRAWFEQEFLHAVQD